MAAEMLSKNTTALPGSRVFLDCLKEKLGDGLANELFGMIDSKIRLAEQTLKACIVRLEKENPDQFS